MNYFISGGCKNGKSYFAQEIARDIAEGKKPLYYIATMIPHDDEDKLRIQRHIASREGWNFTTIEQGRNICEILRGEAKQDGVFLLDSVTALLANEMFRPGKGCNFKAYEKVTEDLLSFAEATGNTVFVSDYIYSEAKVFDGYTESFREGLAHIDRKLAGVCEQVVEVTYGIKYFYKESVNS